MRPLKLTLTAFGPYKDKEIIDFSELQGHRLFVVSGNTGAGKTSIFDAICFALYGSASGEDRNDSRMLRSHFADDGVHTSVDFEFELKGRIYRVWRQLAHTKAGNKGASGEKYELYENVKGEEIPLTDRFIVSQVDEKLREIIGLTMDQFSQIVMLPQGEFRKLLTSETENKEDILRRIFKTGLYKYVADHLNEKRKQIQQNATQLAGIRDYHISNVKGTLANREDSSLYQVFQQQHHNTYQVIEALGQEIDYFAEQMVSKKQQLQAESAKLQKQTALYHQAQHVNEQFTLLDQKNEAKQQLAQQEPIIESQKNRLALAEEAVHLHIYEKLNAETIAELANKTKLFEVSQTESAQAEAARKVAIEHLQREEDKEGLREQTVRELERLKGYLPIVKELHQKQQLVESLAASVDVLSKQMKQAGVELEARQAERSRILAQVKALEDNVLGLPAVTEKLGILRQQAIILQEYINLEQKLIKEAADEKECQEAFELADRAYSLVEERWIGGQAGLLSLHLHNGDSCPVCGSIEHPNKAVMTEDIPSKEELEAARKMKSAAEKKHLEAEAIRTASQKNLREKQQQVVDQDFKLDGIMDAYSELVKEGKALAEEEKRLKEDLTKLVPLKQSLEKLDSKLDELRKQKDIALNSFNEKHTAYATERALYEQSLANLPEEIRDLQKLEQRIMEVDDNKQQLETAWKLAQLQHREANERSIKAGASLSNAEGQRNEALINKEKAQENYFKALKQAGFDSEEAYQAAKMLDISRAELKQQIEAHQTALASVTKQIEELSAMLASKERQDTDTIQQQLFVLEQQIHVLRSEHNAAESSYDKGIEFKDKITQAESNWQEAEREYQLVKDLYDVVRGDNDRKVSFERFVQIEYMEKIIQHANERLGRISGGQYYLVRSDRMEKRGKQSGLGLDVYDNYTGQLRDVKTLSGGEKFNASLCLALGMADVIQSFEGGISLETMFIDEGFGSLDEESLNKAIDTLIDLQQSGRMIGVISHVQELKQAIPAILEVKKTKEGYSYTKFHVS